MKKVLLILILGMCINLTLHAQNKPQSYPNVSLWNIQYSTIDTNGATPSSAYVNQIVNTGGIITGTFSYGYFLQTSNAHAWAAIYVYDKTYKPVVGDSVTLSAKVEEYNKETELDSIFNFKVVSTGNQALTPVTYVAFDSIQQRKYQGLLVKTKDVTCLRFNSVQKWWVFYDSTTINTINCEDTIDNIIMATQKYTPGKRYNITGCIHFEYANWIEPRNIQDIDSIYVLGIMTYQYNSENVNIFPNPTNGKFNAVINSVDNKKNVQLVLTNISGRELYRKQVDFSVGENSIPFNLINLAAGTYLLQVNSATSNAVRKIVIQ